MALTTNLIPLTNGPSVPANIVTWLLSAEDRGLTFTIHENGRLHVGPASASTPTTTPSSGNIATCWWLASPTAMRWPRTRYESRLPHGPS
jgi:hypothetical protein